MGITKSGDRITLSYIAGVDTKGDSIANPFTMDDIVAAGVGVVKNGATEYVVDNLSIYVVGAYLHIYNAFLIFSGTCIDAYCIYNGTNGYIYCGIKQSNGGYSNGAVLNVSELTTARRVRVTHFYDSVVYSTKLYTSTTGTKLNGFYSLYCENSKVTGGNTEVFYSTQFNVYDTQITNCYYGTRSPANGSVFEGCSFIGCEIGALLYMVTGITLKRCKVRNNRSIGIRNQSYALWGSQENTLLSCDYDTYDNRILSNPPEGQDHYSILNIDEIFNLNVTDTSGSTITGASVKLYNKDNTLVFDTTTDSNGDIPEQNVRRIRDEIWKRQPDLISVQTVYNYNPFTLVITYDGKDTYSSTFVIDRETTLKVSIQEQDYIEVPIEVPVEVPVYYQSSLNGTITDNSLSGTLSTRTITGNVVP